MKEFSDQSWIEKILLPRPLSIIPFQEDMELWKSQSSKEESDLLKERLHAITQKHRIQEDIRQRKLQLDQQKLRLQHLKKKTQREQWLLQDYTSHNATDSSQRRSLLSDLQETRALQLNIHRIEMEVECLERKESMISTNESFILSRLKAVEKRPEEIIKVDQNNVISAQSPLGVSVSKNMLTVKSTMPSTTAHRPAELYQHTCLMSYDDIRKSICALNTQEGSYDLTCLCEWSAREVEQKSARVQHHANEQTLSMRKELWRSTHQHLRDRIGGVDLGHQWGHYGNHDLSNNKAGKYLTCRGNWQRGSQDEHCYDSQESHYSRQERRSHPSNQREGRFFENQKGVGFPCGCLTNHQHTSYRVREGWPVSYHNNCIIRSNTGKDGRSNGWTTSRPLTQEKMSASQPQLCYVPANDVPLSDSSDSSSVDEDEELYCYCPPSNKLTLYGGHTTSKKVPSPLFEDDTVYTILNATETTEPITAVFMGFQRAQDDSGQGHELDGSLKAELVIIKDSEDDEDGVARERKSQVEPGGSRYSTAMVAKQCGASHTAKVMGAGKKRIQKKDQSCCTVS